MLPAIHEVDFVPCSYGYRPGLSAPEAIKDLTEELQWRGHELVVKADIKGFFDDMRWAWMEPMLEQRIGDGALLNLIGKWLRGDSGGGWAGHTPAERNTGLVDYQRPGASRRAHARAN